MTRGFSPVASNPYQFSSAYPKDFQIVDGLGQLMPAWQYFFQALWAKTGGGQSTITNTYVVIETPGGPVISGPGPSNGTPVGGVAKSAPVVQTLTSSPWHFDAMVNGFMALSGGEVDYSRDGVNYYVASMLGGQIVMLEGDHINVIWYGAAPTAVWFPGGF
jgi:hypothetical protein